MYQIIQTYIKQGVNPKKILRFTLSVLCRYGFIGLLLFNKQYVEFALNEMKNSLLLIVENINHKKAMLIFKAYTFALTLIKLDCNIYVEQPQNIFNSFNKEFIIYKVNDEGKYFGDNYYVNNENINQCIINLNSMSNWLDNSLEQKTQNILEYYLTNAATGKMIINQDTIFTYILGLYDRIRILSEKYLTETGKKNQEIYKFTILNLCDNFWSFINSISDSEPLIRTEFYKSIIIKIYSCYIHIYEINKEFNKMPSIMSSFENLSRKLHIYENTPSYELVFKVKADYYFRCNDYQTALNYYSKSAGKMREKNPKKSTIYFNLGVLYYYLKDKNNAINYMQKAADHFQMINEERSSYNFHKRNNILAKKSNLARYVIKQIQNNSKF